MNSQEGPYRPEEHGYELVESVSFAEIQQKIGTWLSLKTFPARMFKFVNLLMLTAMGALAGYLIARGEFRLVYIFQFFLGAVGVMLLIPLHEWIHGLAYRISGAKNVIYKAYWNQLVFFAIADGFPAGYKTFRFCAYAPFVMVTPLILAGILLLPALWTAFLIGMLIMHTLSCAGDFGLVSYMNELRESKGDILTMDDAATETTWFYAG